MQLWSNLRTREAARAKLHGLGDRAVPVLESLGQPQEVTAHDAWACLVELGTKKSFEALVRIMRKADSDSYERHSVAAAIAIFLCKNDWTVEDIRGVSGAYDMLVDYVESPRDSWPWTVARLIGRLQYRPGIPRLYEYAKSPEGGVIRRTAQEALRRLGYPLPTSMPSKTRP